MVPNIWKYQSIFNCRPLTASQNTENPSVLRRKNDKRNSWDWPLEEHKQFRLVLYHVVVHRLNCFTFSSCLIVPKTYHLWAMIYAWWSESKFICPDMGDMLSKNRFTEFYCLLELAHALHTQNRKDKTHSLCIVFLNKQYKEIANTFWVVRICLSTLSYRSQ